MFCFFPQVLTEVLRWKNVSWDQHDTEQASRLKLVNIMNVLSSLNSPFPKSIQRANIKGHGSQLEWEIYSFGIGLPRFAVLYVSSKGVNIWVSTVHGNLMWVTITVCVPHILTGANEIGHANTLMNIDPVFILLIFFSYGTLHWFLLFNIHWNKYLSWLLNFFMPSKLCFWVNALIASFYSSTWASGTWWYSHKKGFSQPDTAAKG